MRIPNRAALTEPKLYGYIHPAVPSMTEEMTYAASLTLVTLTPAAAAERSFERTASICWPSVLRRRLATSRHSSTTTMRKTNPRTGLGTLPSRPRKPALEPRSTPASCGWLTGDPRLPAPHVELANPNCSMATTPANVTTAKLTPRTRSADTPTIRPSTAATSVPRIGPHGKPRWAWTIRCETVKPDTPAKVTWASDTCPTKPAMTTSDRQTTMPISDTISACRWPNGNTINNTAPIVVKMMAGRSRCSGRGTAGSRFSTSSPRLGRLAPRNARATTMMTKINSACTPGSGLPRLFGNHDTVAM